MDATQSGAHEVTDADRAREVLAAEYDRDALEHSKQGYLNAAHNQREKAEAIRSGQAELHAIRAMLAFATPPMVVGEPPRIAEMHGNECGCPRCSASLGEKAPPRYEWKCNCCTTVFTTHQEARLPDDNGGAKCPSCKAHGQYTYRYELHIGDPCENCGVAHDDVLPGECRALPAAMAPPMVAESGEMVSVPRKFVEAIRDDVNENRREGRRMCFSDKGDEWRDYLEAPMDAIEGLISTLRALPAKEVALDRLRGKIGEALEMGLDVSASSHDVAGTVEALLKLLAPALPASQGAREGENPWQPIETAKRENGARMILAWDDLPGLSPHWEVGRWTNAKGWVNTYGHPFSGEPTHWMIPDMPLTPSPVVGEG